MVYGKLFPDFQIEKPTKINWGSLQLITMQESGEYLAELKLNEHRGFLLIDDDGNPRFIGHRGNEYVLGAKLIQHIQECKLPARSVFDGGYLSRKGRLDGPRLWIFDILIYKNEKMQTPFRDRKELLDRLIPGDQLLWRPLNTQNFLSEFHDMLHGKSTLIKRAALSYGISVELLKPLIEGLVIKKLDAKPRFSKTLVETTSSYKLRVVDVIESKKNWYTK